jgi:hypothetical protein
VKLSKAQERLLRELKVGPCYVAPYCRPLHVLIRHELVVRSTRSFDWVYITGDGLRWLDDHSDTEGAK